MNVHDFPDDAVARAVPYGIYDVAANQGWVYVGTSAETPDFAVDAIVRWWSTAGHTHYPTAQRILIVADSGGANGCRARRWKERLQRRFADEYGLIVTVCHYPTGCSTWNPVEHRLFSPISRNWAGIPLRSLSILLALIRGTHSSTGLAVEAELLEGDYPTGRSVSKRLMRWLNITAADTCPRWNYTLRPRSLSDPPGTSGIRRLTPWDLEALVG